jgi:hypothetical protein
MSKNFFDKIENRESFLVANDGNYLGKLCLNRFDPDSIVNPYGDYGSKFSTSSIWNKFSTYGSRFSSLSPFNVFTSTPPEIYLRGKKIGFLTKNKFLGPKIVDPDDLVSWMEKQKLNR